MSALCITITDPDTIATLERYQQYVKEQDSIDGTLDDIVEGLLIAAIDENPGFRCWHANAPYRRPGASTVLPFPLLCGPAAAPAAEPATPHLAATG